MMKVSKILLSVVALSVVPVAAHAVVELPPAQTVEPRVSNPAEIVSLKRKITNDLALASGHMMGRKAKARELIVGIEADLAALEKAGGEKADINEFRSDLNDIKSIVR